MSKTSKILDDYLFAPARYLTQTGNIVGGNKFKNAFLMPEVKIGALSVISLGLVFASASTKDRAQLTTIAGAGALIPAFLFARRKEKLDKLKYYFDTKPDRKAPIPSPAIEMDLVYRRDDLLSNFALATIATGVLIPTFNLMIKDLTLTSSLVGVNISMILTKDISSWWYAKQALEGNWNVIMERPKTQKQEKRETVSNFAPAPTPS